MSVGPMPTRDVGDGVRERRDEATSRATTALPGAGAHTTLPGTASLDSGTEVLRLRALVDALARRAAQLQVALESRVVIEQAKGVLVERLRVTPDEAFDVLRSSARGNRMRIHDLAAKVVLTRETPAELERAVTARR